MKILQLIQKPQRRGAEIFAAQLAQELLQQGHEVILVSIFQGEGKLDFSGRQIHLMRPIGMRFFDWKGWTSFSKIIRDFQPDIIQANAADTLKFAVFSKKFYRWKQPIIYRNANQMGDFIRNTFHRRFNQFLLNQVNTIVSVSQASQDDLLKAFRFDKAKSRVIPIGIIPEEIDAKRIEAEKFEFKKPFLLQVGGLVPEKDPIGMLQIFSQIQDNSPNFVFLGSGPLEAELRQQIQAFNLQERVQLIANQENIFPILSQATALVMPSKIEGLPAVILEAMYLKIPVISFNVGGIGEVVKQNTTGWLVPKGNKNAFIMAVKEVLIADQERLTQITIQARKLVKEQYTLEKVTRGFEKVYREVINQKINP